MTTLKMKTIMQKFILQVFGFLLLGTLLFTTACSEDTTDPAANDVAPSASLLAGTGLVSANSQVDAGSIFKVQLKVLAGSNQLQSVTILEEGTKLATTRFSINNGAITSNNPFLLVGTAKDNATYDIAIKVHDGFQVTRKYTFQVTDEKLKTDEVSIDITTKGTELTELTGKLLKNQDGPAGQGGLDLDTGESVGSVQVGQDTSFKRAEINDEGNVSMSNSKWRRVISPTNGAAVRYIDKSKLPETFSYENVKTQEEVIAAFDSGIKFTQVGGDFESNEVKVGDTFTVKTADNRYFIIKVTNITETTGDNNDFYTFSIKKKK